MAFATIEQTPKYSAFINDKTYVRPLANKHLIDWKGGDRLTTLAVDLFHALSLLAKTEVDLSLTAMVDPMRDGVASYNGAFAAAKLALAVIATVQCIQEKAGPEQLSDAEAEELAEATLRSPAIETNSTGAASSAVAVETSASTFDSLVARSFFE